MSTLIRYVALVISGIIFVVSLSPALQRKIASNGWIPDQYRFGDLYNTSNLRKFKELDYNEKATLLPSDKPGVRAKNVDLYTLGDSFTPMDTSFYAGRKNYHIWLGAYIDTVKLDPSKKSVLVIEVIERTIQERLRNDYQAIYFDKGFQIEGKLKPKAPDEAADEPSFWWDKFGDQINQRIEFLLFNFDPFLKLKELKSSIMLSWFDRTHTGAIISRNHEYLFYNIEADKEIVLSPFYNITAGSVDTVVNNMNSIRDYYKGAGFDEVYFCFVPNKVTVCENDRFPYNNQISRVENHPKLQTPVLSIQDTIRSHPEWYHLGDGHWTVKGQRYWLKTVNQLVMDWDRKAMAGNRN